MMADILSRVAETALALADRGFNVFPVLPNDKKPAVKSWQTRATRDPGEIAEMFDRDDLNIAIRTDKCGEAFIIVLDIDDKNGKQGSSELRKLEAEHGQLPPTLSMRTPNNGEHKVFIVGRQIGNSVDKIAPGLDIRGYNGYIVAPGSKLPGGRYEFIDERAQIALAPAWLSELARNAAAPVATASAKREPVPGVKPDKATARAISYLKTAPLSVEGQGGDQTAYKVAAALKDKGCNEAQALELMLEHWNDRCSPPWSIAELTDKVVHAFKYGREQPGIAAPEAVFNDEITATTDDAQNESPLAKMNREYAFVIAGESSRILWETTDSDGNYEFRLLDKQTFLDKLASTQIQFGRKAEPIAKAWLEWPGRRSYDGIVFEPGRDVGSRWFNMWRGFAAKPAPGDWSLMRAHIRDVICSGDAELDRYVMGWLARLVQRPGEPGEVALVLRGGRGAGKGTLGYYIEQMFGQHAKHISNAKHLTGSFNAHLRSAVFVFADEAFWAGDKQHESVLKDLITGRTQMIEAKGKDAITVKSCIHLFMASNDQWVVPAGPDERRFCVIDVSAAQAQRSEYFDPLHDQMQNGGTAAMLHDLLHYDLTGFDVRKVPQTKALSDQKLRGMRGTEQWLFDCLNNGFIAGELWGESPVALRKATVHESYANKAKTHYGEYKPADTRSFWFDVKRILAKGSQPLGETRPAGSERLAVFPPLAETRLAFEVHMRSAIEWEDAPQATAPAVFAHDIFS